MSSTQFIFEDINPISIQEKTIKYHINKLINNEFKKVGDITVIFCSDNYLLDVNKQYLNHNYYTDIITFDYVEDNVISGDLFISIDRVKENAEEYAVSLIKELYRVVFHGVLHLIGYNDKSNEEQQVMTQKENFYLAKVDFKGMEL